MFVVKFLFVQSLSHVTPMDYMTFFYLFNYCFLSPMEYSMPGFPVIHYLPEFAQTRVYWVGDAIQPFHLLSFPSPVFKLSQHQSLF